MKFDSVLQKAVFDEYLTVDGADTYIKVIQDFPAVSSHEWHCVQHCVKTLIPNIGYRVKAGNF